MKEYLNKRVLVTGHTGFKGSWLSMWLLKQGAIVCGISNDIPTEPSMFKVLDLDSKVVSHFIDIRDKVKVLGVLEDFKPDFVFHLAAQAIVSTSYEDPLETISTNIMGTAVVLDALREWNQKCNAVIITSDKCYENVEWVWGYKETDHLGGKDIYSGSKGAAEIICHAYYHSFFSSDSSNIRIAMGRAGNVIGGGDWAKDRLVVDCMKNWSKGNTVELRSPDATRPWQHVLEPLSGYLTLGVQLAHDDHVLGESYNFGPKSEQNRTVLELLKDLSKNWEFESDYMPFTITDRIPFHEAGLLKLNCDKALFGLKWEANLTYYECVKLVGDWYHAYYRSEKDMFDLTMSQITEYEEKANIQKLIWTK